MSPLDAILANNEAEKEVARGILQVERDLALSALNRALAGGANGAAELWTIRGGSHIPNFNDSWAPSFYDWLLAHSR